MVMVVEQSRRAATAAGVSAQRPLATVRRLARLGELRGGGGARRGTLDLDVVDGLVAAWGGGRRWPALVVHAATGLVVDGTHRLEAAWRLGLPEVEVVEVVGSDDEAFLAGVRANHLDGRPLTPEDRRAAVERIVAAFPHLTYREVTTATGASAGVVSRARAAMGVPGAREVESARATDPLLLLQRLARDPSMTQTPQRRDLLRAMGAAVEAVRRGGGEVSTVPAHRADQVAALLRWCADQVLASAELR